MLTDIYITLQCYVYNYSGLQPHSVIVKIFFSSSGDDVKVSVLYFVGTQALFFSVMSLEHIVTFSLYENNLFKLSFPIINNDTYDKIGIDKHFCSEN